MVSDVSLVAERGQVTALLGANGAGKTTTIECAQGLQKRTGGTITLLGARIPDTAGAELRARVGVMLQDGGLPPSARPIPLLRHIAGMYRTHGRWMSWSSGWASTPSAAPMSAGCPADRSSGWPSPQR